MSMSMSMSISMSMSLSMSKSNEHGLRITNLTDSTSGRLKESLLFSSYMKNCNAVQ